MIGAVFLPLHRQNCWKSAELLEDVPVDRENDATKVASLEITPAATHSDRHVVRIP
jgi:hypothetical protein